MARSEPRTGVVDEPNVRARTRSAIVEAAVRTLSVNSNASLTEVAAEAGVGRTTVHRYFPERADLIAALAQESERRIDLATERATSGSGPAIDVALLLAQDYLELGDWLTLVFTQTLSTDDLVDDGSPTDPRWVALIDRGQAEGSIDSTLSADWLVNVIWSLLFATWAQIRSGLHTRHDATTLLLVTLRKAMAA